MHIKARLLVVYVFDIGPRKTQKLCFLKPRTGGSFTLNSQKVVSYFVLPAVSHVEHPRISVGEDGPSVSRTLVFLVGDSPLLCVKLAVVFPETEEVLSLSCIPCQ
jgi:hypothetical protein